MQQGLPQQQAQGVGAVMRPPPRMAVLYRGKRGAFGCRYECETRAALAARLAALQGMDYGGIWEPVRRYGGPVYYVPHDTLDASTARALGIRDERDLFGGVVPHPFVATKAITQPLVDHDAVAPDGWSHAFHARGPNAVLRGFTAFSLEDARRAGERLLAHGPFRVKPVRATGGKGQSVVADHARLERALSVLQDTGALAGGVVLEENLEQVTTLSIGRVRVGELLATYTGTQDTTTDNHGESAYGGSDLTVVRGDFGALLAQPLPEDARLALAQVRSYDLRAREIFPGLIISRANYDVAQGVDAKGRRRSGVLEQSWRIGGATPAELVALELLAADPALDWVRAECREVYGRFRAPADATVLYAGDDPDAGPITLYARVLASGRAAEPCAAS